MIIMRCIKQQLTVSKTINSSVATFLSAPIDQTDVRADREVQMQRPKTLGKEKEKNLY